MIYQERELGKIKRRRVSLINRAKIYPAECEEDFAPSEVFTFPHVFAEL